jgi:putative hydrolase of the HAD superfamily
MAIADVRAVLFDADGVVQRTAPSWRAELEALCPDPERIEPFVSAIFAAEAPCLTGAGDFPAALQTVLRRFGCDRPVDDALRIWTLIEPVEEVLYCAQRLRERGIGTGLATNQQRYRAAFMTGALGYAQRFDHLFYSCELGHAKPSAGYFGAVLERLRVQPEAVLFVDDHSTNVEAARTVGLRAEVFHVDHSAAELQRLLREHGLPAD